MKLKLISIVVLTVILMYTPYVNTFVKVFNTMFHEGGHAIMTLLTHGKVSSISLFSNVEGVTMSSSSSWFSEILISLSGYIFASFISFLFCFLWSKYKYKTVLLSTLIFSLLSTVLWVRNLFGISWLLVASALLFVVLFKIKNTKIISIIALVLSLVLLTESIFSAYDILYLSYTSPKDAGDASNLASFTLLPALIWGVVFFTQSLVFGFFSLKFLWKAKEIKSLLSR